MRRRATSFTRHAAQLVLDLLLPPQCLTCDAQPLATMMARAGSILLARADIIVPVPLHRTRLRERHYNQAALLAHALAKHRAARAIPDALIRARPTPSLGSLTAAARAEIVGDAFAVRPHRLAAINGQRILLVDDVMTSGATARACTDVLLDAGAAAVDVLVAARVPDPRGT
jgi:predicted amidophosphoribosyltransferase